MPSILPNEGEGVNLMEGERLDQLRTVVWQVRPFINRNSLRRAGQMGMNAQECQFSRCGNVGIVGTLGILGILQFRKSLCFERYRLVKARNGSGLLRHFPNT